MSNQTDIATLDGVSEIAQALGIQPSMTNSRKALSTLVGNLAQHRLIETYFLPFFTNYNWKEDENYDWSTHSQDPKQVLGDVAAFWNSLNPDLTMSEMGFDCHSMQSFSELQIWFRRAIATETRLLIPDHGADLLWYPVSHTHGDAFGYTLFLWMYMQTNSAPTIISQLYSGALRHLAEFRCPDCGTDFVSHESGDDPLCRVCPTLMHGETLEYPWG